MKETTYEFCKKTTFEVPGAGNRMSFFIESPNFPKLYLSNKDCSMKFKVRDWKF